MYTLMDTHTYKHIQKINTNLYNLLQKLEECPLLIDSFPQNNITLIPNKRKSKKGKAPDPRAPELVAKINTLTKLDPAIHNSNYSP